MPPILNASASLGATHVKNMLMTKVAESGAEFDEVIGHRKRLKFAHDVSVGDSGDVV